MNSVDFNEGDLKDYAEQLFSGGFSSSTKRLDVEQESRVKDTENIKKFGIKYLDDCLRGLSTRDIVVVGAQSGVGKTELLTHLALNLSRAGSRVHYFALEAETNEIERRIKYKNLAALYFSDPERPKIPHLSYAVWKSGEHSFELGAYEDQAKEITKKDMENVSTYYKDEKDFEFNVDTFCEKIKFIRGSTDLVIVDHLNYFDKKDPRDMSEVFKIMKHVRYSALNMGVPFILASQVRKRDKRDSSLVPDMEEIFGSSDVYKIATKVIMFAPNYAYKARDKKHFATLFRCQKNRDDSTAGRFVGEVLFDTTRNLYSDEYGMYSAHGFKQNSNLLTGIDYPYWATIFTKEPKEVVEQPTSYPYKDD